MTKSVRKNTKTFKTSTKKHDTKAINLKPKGFKACVGTLVLQIIFTITLTLLPLAPFFGWLFAMILMLFLVIGIVITTICSFGMLWIADEYRNFWVKVCEAIKKCYEGTGTIVEALKPHIVWISILMFVISSVGFIYNLIYYKKHKANKGCFIASCVLLGVAFLAMIASMIVILTFKAQ